MHTHTNTYEHTLTQNHHRASQPLEEFAGAPDRAMLVPEVMRKVSYLYTRNAYVRHDPCIYETLLYKVGHYEFVNGVV